MTNLLVNEPDEYCDNEREKLGMMCECHDDRPHKQGRDGGLLQQLLQHHAQHLGRVDVALLEAQPRRCTATSGAH